MDAPATRLTGIAVLSFASLGLPDGVFGVGNGPRMRIALGLGMAELGGLRVWLES
jgi:hypothetical protein